MSGTWRLDRSIPLNADPEYFPTRQAAEQRELQLRLAGSSAQVVVWFDVAAYVPIETTARIETTDTTLVAPVTLGDRIRTALTGRTSEGAA